MSDTFTSIKVEKRDRITKILLNRPEKLNSINLTVLEEMERAINTIQNDAETSVLILTGAEAEGKKPAFSAGADISQLFALPISEEKALEISLRGQAVLKKLEGLPKPVIAMVNGYCLGGGCEFMLACDLVVAAEEAEIGQPEVSLGILPGWGGTQRLPRRVGFGQTLRLLLTGEKIKGEEAASIGLVDYAVPKEKLEEFTMKLAEDLASKSVKALAEIKRTVRGAYELSLSEGLGLEAQAFSRLLASEEAKEGITAFLERRKPKG